MQSIRVVFKWLPKKTKPKQLLRPITTGADSAMNQSLFLEITCNSLVAREKSRVHGAVRSGFDSHWLKNWRESFKPITKRSNRNHVITFDCHLKTALFSTVLRKVIHNVEITILESSLVKRSINEEVNGFPSSCLQVSLLKELNTAFGPSK